MQGYRTHYRITIAAAAGCLAAGIYVKGAAGAMIIACSIVIIAASVTALLQVSRYVRIKELKISDMNSSARNKDLLFSLVIHDLKGPAQNLSLLCELMQKDFSEKDQKQILKHIQTSVKKHFALLDKLLEWTKTEVKASRITDEGCDLAEVVKEICKSNKLRCESKEILLMNYLDEPVQVNTQQSVVETVLRNIMDNAIKYTHGGGVITISAKREPEGINIAIKDTGLGMSKEAIDLVFNAGPRYRQAGTMKEEGSGIGLYLCNELVKNAGGKITVKSIPGEGSTFMFYLPEKKRVEKTSIPVTVRMFL